MNFGALGNCIQWCHDRKFSIAKKRAAKKKKRRLLYKSRRFFMKKKLLQRNKGRIKRRGTSRKKRK